VSLEVRQAAIRRGAFVLAVDFEAPSEGVTVVFGPSGAGKSMLLSTIAGLHRLEAGRVSLNHRVLDDVEAKERIAPHLRGVGLVFQDARLFPHLSVRGNLAYAERRRPADRVAPTIDEIAAQLDIANLLDRDVRNLSGGEKSRVALARSLLSAPELLLLDEPFAALDGRRRRAFLEMLRSISTASKLPMMVVTHQIEDAAELADYLIALKDGAIVAGGPAATAMRRREFLALLDRRDLGSRIDASAIPGGPPGRGVWIRSDSVIVASEKPHGLSARNVWEGLVASIFREPDDSVLISIATQVGYVSSRITPDALADLRLVEGAKAWAVVKTHSI
jgi:molybdate transport system ATP-binding protein